MPLYESHGTASAFATVLRDSTGNPDIWLLELARGIPSRLTFGESFGTRIWSPDGQRMAYHRLNGRRLFARSANGPEQEEPPLESQYTVYLNDWSTDGPYLVYSQVSPEGRCERWLLPTTGDRKPAPFLQTSFDEMRGQVSPNSESIAYTSNESGRNEIYVQSFPGGGAGWLVSGGGGSLAR